MTYSDFEYNSIWLNNQFNNYPVNLSMSLEPIEGLDTSTNEGWINYIISEGKNVSLNSFVKNSDGWNLSDDNRLFCSTTPNYISFPITTLPLSMNYVFHPWSGQLVINFNHHSKVLQLNQAEPTWDYVNFKFLFYNEITEDIHTLISVFPLAQYIYIFLLSLCLGIVISCPLLKLYIFISSHPKIKLIATSLMLLTSLYFSYKIATNTLISYTTIEFYNSSTDSANSTVCISLISSSGCAGINTGYEMNLFETGDWDINYADPVSLISRESTTNPLIYTVREPSFTRFFSASLTDNFVLTINKSPQGGILTVKSNDIEQTIDCYSSVPQTANIMLAEIFPCHFHFDPTTIVILIFIFLLFVLIYKNRRVYHQFVSEENKPQKIYRSFISLAFAFMLAGQELFFNEQEIVSFSLLKLLVLLLIAFITFFLLPCIILLIRKICNCFYNPEAKTPKSIPGIFFIILSIVLIWYFIFIPGGLSLDIIAQLEQTQGLTIYSDWHPIFHTILLKLFTFFDSNIIIYFLFQLFFITVVLTLVANFMIVNGTKENVVISTLIIFLILPINEILTEATKDVLGTYSYIWIILLTAKIVLHGPEKFWSNYKNIIQSVIALFFAMNIRHSQQSVCIVFLIICIYSSFRLKTKRKTTLLFITGFLCFNSIFSYAINKSTSCYNYTTGLKYVTPIADLASLAVNDLEISDSTKELVEAAMPVEEWKTFYNAYYPGAALLENNVDFANIFAGFSLRNVLTVYIENLIKHPQHIIRSRLLGSHIIWGICESSDSQARNQHHYFEAQPNPFGYERSNSLLKLLAKDYVTYYHDFKLIDTLLWRSGIHIFFLLIVLYITARYSRPKNCTILLPCIVFTVLLCIALPAPNYRYIYYLPVTSLFMILLLPILINKYPTKK